MSLLGLLFVVGVIAAEELVIVGDPATASDNEYFNCSKISSTPAATFQDRCIETNWCIFNKVAQSCLADPCLAWIDDSSSCPSTAPLGGGTVACGLFYIHQQHNCTTGAFDVYTDRYCRLGGGLDATYAKSSLGDNDCFYEDLKSIGRQDDGKIAAGGARSCGRKVCSWHSASGTGQYCDYGGGQDCSGFGDLEFICPCLQEANCDLQPGCIVSSHQCIVDTCNQYNPTSQSVTLGNPCTTGPGSPISNCLARAQWYYDDAGTLQSRKICVNQSNADPNECFYAIKETITKPSGAANGFPECWNYTYDDSVCSAAQTYKKSDPAQPSDPAAFCQLVSIAPGYFSASQYCTDGDRTVPAPNASKIIGVPSVIALLLLLLVGL